MILFSVTAIIMEFQSTHPSGVRHPSSERSYAGMIFQSTHPSGVRPVSVTIRSAFAIFQSTHPSGVRHMASTLDHIGKFISIHAPQWGATRSLSRLEKTQPISIHAPQWGATTSLVTCVFCWIFQSTHPSGVRLGGERSQTVFRSISIHAPQWGATAR